MSKEDFKQFCKFSLVGVANTLVDWIVFFVLTLIFVSKNFEPFAKVIGFIVAVLNSFLLNSSWTFNREYKNAKKDSNKVFLKFLLVSLIGLGINSLVFVLLRFNFNQSKIVSLIFATLFALMWNFLANKFWSYR